MNSTKTWTHFSLLLSTALLAGLFIGCGGEGDGGTSNNATVSVELSGTYQGTAAGGRAVPNMVLPDGSDSSDFIHLFHISASGGSLSVQDDQGGSYSGSATIPDSVPRQSGSYAIGEHILEVPASFSGYCVASESSIDFAGTIIVQATQPIEGVVVQTLEPSTNSGIQAQLVYTLTAANTECLLQGTWLDSGHEFGDSTVSARAAGNAGTITVNPVQVP